MKRRCTAVLAAAAGVLMLGAPSSEAAPTISPVLLQEMLPVGEQVLERSGDRFGTRIAIDGDLAVVGAPFDDLNDVDLGDPGVKDAGSAYVFRLVDGAWEPYGGRIQADPDCDPDDPDDGPGVDHWFGLRVDISGERVVVGARGPGNPAGTAYIFEYNAGEDCWDQVASLAVSDAKQDVDDNFGSSVAIEGDVVMVGAKAARLDGEPEPNPHGLVYVFERQADGSWPPVATLAAIPRNQGDEFGASIALEGGRAIVGAQRHRRGGGNVIGTAFVFEAQASDWGDPSQYDPQAPILPVATLVSQDGELNDLFGLEVALSGDTVLVAAENHDNDSQGVRDGAVYLFEAPAMGWPAGNTVITETLRLVPNEPVADLDTFGRSVAIDDDLALVGSLRNNLPGVVYAFGRDNGVWGPDGTVINKPADNAVGQLGTSVAIAGGGALLGAELSVREGVLSGAVLYWGFFSDVDDDGEPDLTDPCPADPLDNCVTEGSAAAEASVDEGGTVATPDGQLEIVVDPGDLAEDTTLSITEFVEQDPEVDVSIGGTPGAGQALALYAFEPDGVQFASPVTINVEIDVTSLNATKRERLDIYRFEDTDGDTIPDTFVALGATCSVLEDPPGTFTATCSLQLDHFSTYTIVVPRDSDDDGIPDDFEGIADVCPDENATGFDVDNDGCIDSYTGLTDLVANLVAEEVISPEMENSLIRKVENAQSSTEREQVCAAVNQLDAFSNQVEAQRGEKISDEAADLVNAYAESVRLFLLASLPAGTGC